MRINKWRLSLLIVLPITAMLIIWLCATLPIDQPKLYLRLLGAVGVMVVASLFNGYKAIGKGY